MLVWSSCPKSHNKDRLSRFLQKKSLYPCVPGLFEAKVCFRKERKIQKEKLRCEHLLPKIDTLQLKFMTQLSTKACPNTLLPKTLNLVQQHPKITKLLLAITAYSHKSMLVHNKRK